MSANAATSGKKLDRYRMSPFPKQPLRANMRGPRSAIGVGPATHDGVAATGGPGHAEDGAAEAPGELGAAVLQAIFHHMDESKARVVDVFRMLDKDGSGELDAWEFSEAMQHIGLQLSREELEQVMECLDKDGGGSVDIVEFMARMKAERRRQRQGGGTSQPLQLSRAKAAPEPESEGERSSYASRLSLVRPPLNPKLHPVDWNVPQPNDKPYCRFSIGVERAGEEVAARRDGEQRCPPPRSP